MMGWYIRDHTTGMLMYSSHLIACDEYYPDDSLPIAEEVMQERKLTSSQQANGLNAIFDYIHLVSRDFTYERCCKLAGIIMRVITIDNYDLIINQALKHLNCLRIIHPDKIIVIEEHHVDNQV
jgi:hypothetical protein